MTSVPDSNIRLFDEMQAHGLIIPTPEGKAIWSCDITADSGWTPGCPLTLLRLSPSRLWGSPEERPVLFAGRVKPVEGSAENAAHKNTIQPTPATQPANCELADLTLSLFAPQETDADIPQTVEENTTVHSAEMRPSSPTPSTGVDQKGSPPATIGTSSSRKIDFMVWLRESIRSHNIAVNKTLAPVHMVEGKVFLVSPEIFRLYIKTTAGSTGEEWKLTQKAFQRLNLHQRGNDGINIFVCEVKGPRKTRRVKG